MSVYLFEAFISLSTVYHQTYNSINIIINNIIKNNEKLNKLLFNEDKKQQLILFNLFIHDYKNKINLELCDKYSNISDITENIFNENIHPILDEQTKFIKDNFTCVFACRFFCTCLAIVSK